MSKGASMIIDHRKLDSRDGFELVAEILPDDLTPAFYGVNVDYMNEGGYSLAQESEFNDGDWSFVTVRVRAIREGITLGDATLGGCEYGTSSEWTGWISPLTDDADVIPSLIDEAIADAQDTLARIVGRTLA